VEDEVDVEGDDEDVFGDVQFTEGDILGPTSDPPLDVSLEEDLENGDTQREQKTLRDLVAEGKVLRRRLSPGTEHVKAKMDEIMGVGDADKMDLAIAAARKQGNAKALITALENKVKQLVRPSFQSSLLNSSTACRNQCESHPQRPYCAAYAWTLIPSPRHRQAAGTHAVENVGYAVLVRQNCALFANESRQPES
jgi:hypothetical protein